MRHNVGCLKLPVGSNKFVGLLGILDDDNTNNFTAANGTVLDLSAYPSSSLEEKRTHFQKFWKVMDGPRERLFFVQKDSEMRMTFTCFTFLNMNLTSNILEIQIATKKYVACSQVIFVSPAVLIIG